MKKTEKAVRRRRKATPKRRKRRSTTGLFAHTKAAHKHLIAVLKLLKGK
jgi:hypothetical protein